MAPMKNHNKPDLSFLFAITAANMPHQKLKPNKVIGRGGVGDKRTAAVFPINARPTIITNK